MSGPRPAGPATDPGTVLILGASSMIARATATALAKEGYDLVLTGRSAEETGRIAADLAVRHGVKTDVETFDAADTDAHAALIKRVIDASEDRLAGVIVAFGLLGDAGRAEREYSHAEEIVAANYLGAVSVLTLLTPYFEEKQGGFIVGISSVAGDRGRQSNFTYGSAKGGFSLYLQGLRNKLHRSGVQVLTVKPGFIDTRMTYGEVEPRMAADPAIVADAILKGIKKKKSVIYVPWIWRYIMLVIRQIPEPIFKRLKL
jgi:short-subunit dehydrogenase